MDSNSLFFYLMSMAALPAMNPWVHSQARLNPVANEETPKSENKKYKRTWKKNDIHQIFNRASEYCEENKRRIEDLTIKDFLIIGENFKQTPEQIMIKVNEIHRSGTLRPGIWANNEDYILSSLVSKGKYKWGQIAEIINQEVHCSLKVRNGTQCKERWNNYLDPNISRGPWTPGEDCKILRGFREHGKKWSLIGKLVVSRTESAIKNRVKSLLNKIKQNLGAIEHLDNGIDEYIQGVEAKNLELNTR